MTRYIANWHIAKVRHKHGVGVALTTEFNPLFVEQSTQMPWEVGIKEEPCAAVALPSDTFQHRDIFRTGIADQSSAVCDARPAPKRCRELAFECHADID
jgi:hypothetical protein